MTKVTLILLCELWIDQFVLVPCFSVRVKSVKWVTLPWWWVGDEYIRCRIGVAMMWDQGVWSFKDRDPSQADPKEPTICWISEPVQLKLLGIDMDGALRYVATLNTLPGR